MADRHTITIDTGAAPNTMGPFHGLLRARYRARGIVNIDHRGRVGEIIVDIALGEGGAERGVLRLDQRGPFVIPAAIPERELVSVRCQGTQPRMPVTIMLELERENGASSGSGESPAG